MNWITHHQVFCTFIATILVNAAVTSMPSPKPASSAFYEWFFGFTHSVLLNLGRLIANQYPQSVWNKLTGNGDKSDAAGVGK